MSLRRSYFVPVIIAFSNGCLSVLGISSGYEVYFWVAAILSAGVIFGFQAPKKLFLSSVLMGFLIAAGTGVPQIIFMGTYFQNNPDYVVLVDKLPMQPRLYTAVMIPVFGMGIGLIVMCLSLLIAKVK